MFTNSAAAKIDQIAAPKQAPDWFGPFLEQLKDGLRDMVGQCNANLDHRGPVNIENTHPSPDTQRPDGEPGLTVCTYAANDTAPDPMLSLFVKCGKTKVQEFQADGPSIFNDCVTMNDNLLLAGLLSNVRIGYSSSLVRVCLTSGFSGGCASAQVIGTVDNGTCKPTYIDSGDGSGPVINVIDKGGYLSLCAGAGQCGYAAYFSATDITSDCNLGANVSGYGYYEAIPGSFDPPSTNYNQCSVRVLDNVCCVGSTLVKCYKTIYFSTPIRVGAVDCNGSGSAVCS